MKTLLLSVATLMAFALGAQTSKIALQKHSLSVDNIEEVKNHNFGLNPEYVQRNLIESKYDTLEYFTNGCVIAHVKDRSKNQVNDTLCDLFYVRSFQLSSDQIQQQLNGSHVLINFEKYDEERLSKLLEEPTQNGFKWYYSLFLLAFIPFFKLEKNEI